VTCGSQLQVPGYGTIRCTLPTGHDGLCTATTGGEDRMRGRVVRRWLPGVTPGTDGAHTAPRRQP